MAIVNMTLLNVVQTHKIKKGNKARFGKKSFFDKKADKKYELRFEIDIDDRIPV